MTEKKAVWNRHKLPGMVNNTSDSLAAWLNAAWRSSLGSFPKSSPGSSPGRSKARMAKLVDACDLKSHPVGCWFDSSYEQMVDFFLLRRNRMFNKSKYSRNRQLARVIFYFAIYINILIIYGIFFAIYGLALYHGWAWWLVFSAYTVFFFSFFLRTLVLMFMFTFKFYRILKAAFLVDFFVKKVIALQLYFLVFINTIFFSEKFFIEYQFLQLNKVVRFFYQLTDFARDAVTFKIFSAVLMITAIWLIINACVYMWT